MAKMKVTDFIGNVILAKLSKTVYMWGCFGHPVGQTIIDQKKAQYPTWYTAARVAYFESLIGQGYFAFDCVNLFKGVLWGWDADPSKFAGGAAYGTQGVPDVNANGFFERCTNKSSNFSAIPVGAILWTDGHVGMYAGNREAWECTFRWDDGVQVTGVRNMGNTITKSRTWKQWGLSPYVDYTNTAPDPIPEEPEEEDETPVPDDYVHPDRPEYETAFTVERIPVQGFQPLGANTLYQCDMDDFVDGWPPDKDENGQPVPDGAIVEVSVSEPPQYSDLYRRAFGRWWRYGSDDSSTDFSGYPSSPLSPELFPVQIIAYDAFQNQTKLFGMKEELYRKTLFANGTFSLAGRDTDRFDGTFCILQGSAWGKPTAVRAPGWTVKNIFRCNRSVWTTKTGSEILFAANGGV
jgi:hypothetical protein